MHGPSFRAVAEGAMEDAVVAGRRSASGARRRSESGARRRAWVAAVEEAEAMEDAVVAGRRAWFAEEAEAEREGLGAAEME